MSLIQRVGNGTTLAYDVAGGTNYVVIASVVNIDKTESKWNVAKTTLLSQKATTKQKAGEYDPGQVKFTIAYDPLFSEYTALKANHVAQNLNAPTWQVSFPASGVGSGSGATSETFAGHIVALSREFKKEDFLMCELTIDITGEI